MHNISFATELHLPPASQAASNASAVAWLDELQELRGRVLYDNGRRPNFLQPNGSYRDSDALDLVSYHLIVRWRGHIAGCARVTPLTQGTCGVVEETLGTDGFETMLAAIGATRGRTSEASRWIVAPEFRGGSLGFHLVAASWALGQWLGAQIGFVAAGTRNRQDTMLIRMGARSTNLPKVHSEEFDDELHILHFDVQRPSRSMISWIEHMNLALGLELLLERASRNGTRWTRIRVGNDKGHYRHYLRPTHNATIFSNA